MRTAGNDKIEIIDWKLELERRIQAKSPMDLKELEGHIDRLKSNDVSGSAEAKYAAIDCVTAQVARVIEEIAQKHDQTPGSMLGGVADGLKEIVDLARLRLQIEEVAKELSVSVGTEIRKSEAVPIIQRAMKKSGVDRVVLVERNGLEIGIDATGGLFGKKKGDMFDGLLSARDLEAAGTSPNEIRGLLAEILIDVAKRGKMPVVVTRERIPLVHWRERLERALDAHDREKVTEQLQLLATTQVMGSPREKRHLLEKLANRIDAVVPPETFHATAKTLGSSEVAELATSREMQELVDGLEGGRKVLATNGEHALTLGHFTRDSGDNRTFTYFLDVDGRCAHLGDLPFFGLDVDGLDRLLERIKLNVPRKALAQPLALETLAAQNEKTGS